MTDLALHESDDVVVIGCDLGFGSDCQTVSLHLASEAVYAVIADERSLAQLMVSEAQRAIPRGYRAVGPAVRSYDMAADFYVFTWRIEPLSDRVLGDGT